MIPDEQQPQPEESPLRLPLEGMGLSIFILGIAMLIILGILSLFTPLGADVWITAIIAFVAFVIVATFRQLLRALTGL